MSTGDGCDAVRKQRPEEGEPEWDHFLGRRRHKDDLKLQ